MADIQTPTANEQERLEAAIAFNRANLACAFGPSFFLGYLARFVRDQCPNPRENLPVVQLRLSDGEVLDVCHIIGVSPRFVVLAVHDASSHPAAMAIEVVPFERIQGVSVRTRRAEGGSVGFAQTRAPDILAAETLLQAVMPPARAEGEGGDAPPTAT